MMIQKNSKWVFMGGPEGHGLVHTVIVVSGNQVTTWSDLEQGDENDAGYSWQGVKNDFIKLFEPLYPMGKNA